MESPKKFFPLTRGEAGKGFSSVPCQQRLVVEQLLITVRGEALSQVFCGGLSAVRSYPILHIVSWGDEEGYISQPKFWITDPPPPSLKLSLECFFLTDMWDNSLSSKGKHWRCSHIQQLVSMLIMGNGDYFLHIICPGFILFLQEKTPHWLAKLFLNYFSDITQ